MRCIIQPQPCAKDSLLPLMPASGITAHCLQSGSLPSGAGWQFIHQAIPVFQITGTIWMSPGPDAPASAWPLLRALTEITRDSPIECELCRQGHAIAVITLSDKGSQGLRTDTAGPLAARMLAEALPVCLSRHFLIPDDPGQLRGLLAELALIQKFDLVCTSGGTGVSPRDITPQVTASLLDYPLPGFGEAMRTASLAKTPNAVISRAICGVIGSCLVVNLPGSLKAVRENLEAILPGLGHALAKLQGDTTDCGN